MRATRLACAALLAAAPALAQDADAGLRLYVDFCAVCHGIEGTGDGPMAEILTIRPPDLTRLTDMADGDAFPTLAVVQQIDGRRRMAAHGGDMPMFGRWFQGDGPDVALAGPGGQPILVSRPIADLVAYLQGIQS
jgi:mono/diheme cytochrome c family protein